jgi:hypothetical protein
MSTEFEPDGDDRRDTDVESTHKLLFDVLGVFDKHGLGSWVDLTTVRDELPDYDPTRVWDTIDFLGPDGLGLVVEDMDCNVRMRDDDHSRDVLDTVVSA